MTTSEYMLGGLGYVLLFCALAWALLRKEPKRHDVKWQRKDHLDD